MKGVLYFMAWHGIYDILMRLWQFAEEAELGYTIITKTDTVICFMLSLIVFGVVVVLEISEEV